MSGNDGANAVQLSSFGISTTGSPCWSPDGKLIVFDSRVEGLSNIYIVDPKGGVPQKLDIDIPDNNAPRWSHDGKWIYFENGEDSHRPTIWKVSSSGGHAVQIAGAEAEMPTESGDGRYVYFVRQSHLWRIGTDGSGEQQIAEMPRVRFDAWTPVGTGIYFISAESEREIRFFDLNTKSTRVIYVMEKSPPWGWVGGLPVSSDGKWLLVPQVDEESSDLMMIEHWQ
jgi:Tol biopolymer transport system component